MDILESEGLAQSPALGVGGQLRVWDEDVWPLGPAVSTFPFTPEAAKGSQVSLCVSPKGMEVLKYQPPGNSELPRFIL